MIIVGIDPGLQCTGVAILDTDVGEEWTTHSVRTKYQRHLPERIQEIVNHVDSLLPFRADLLIIEKMQVYQGEKQKGNPNDLVDISILVGALTNRLQLIGRVELPLPCTWKGQVDKAIHHRRIRKRVPGLGRISKDALDAVGLALYGKELYDARTKKRQ